ncbi:MAG: TAXI family TRAP transporter solute-binding subunit [Deltaproteobacteria bacterium]|jgi:TRAP transporter TAXI family solute receptor|nr:TAXI family TRAP transporter solute-binding subunit [Deltaproteobacteria bacterium]
MSKKLVFKFLALAFCFGLVATFQPMTAEAQSGDVQYIVIGTGGQTGVYYPTGGAICRIFNRIQQETGQNIDCKIESTSASVFNVNTIRSDPKHMFLGIVQSDVQYQAYNGVDQFQAAGPDTNLRVLANLQSESFTLVARKDANIATFDDLAGKRMNLGDPGSGNRNTLELLMQEYGWTAATFKLATDLKPAEMAGALCDNKIDAYVYVIAHPNGSLTEATSTCDSVVVPVTGAKVDSFIAKYPFYPKAVIPGGMYKGTDADVNTFGPKATLMVHAELPEEIAYQVTKAIFTNVEELKNVHPALSGLSVEDMLKGSTVPFHPGALRYFKEAGLQVN